MGTPTHFVYPIYYTLQAGKRKPLFCGTAHQISIKFLSGKKTEPGVCPAPARTVYFWKVTPLTVTLTAVTLSPLVLSTALNTFSCTALATSVTP